LQYSAKYINLLSPSYRNYQPLIASEFLHPKNWHMHYLLLMWFLLVDKLYNSIQGVR
jgi:hypothetical protein